MRTRNFVVPVDLIEPFARAIEENNFTNCIEGVTDDGDIEVSIDYSLAEKKIINHCKIWPMNTLKTKRMTKSK